MIKNTKILGIATALSFAAVTGASAAIIDFTNAATGASGSVQGVGWTLSSSGDLTNVQNYDGTAPNPPAEWNLALDRDGYGVVPSGAPLNSDDEISYIGESEYITITFDRSVKVSAVAFLDLFRAGSEHEIGYATDNNGNVTTVNSFFSEPGNGGGFAEGATGGYWLTSLTFTVDATNDYSGVADGALAAIDVSAVPVPAAGFLLLGGLGGLAAMRRRRKS